MNLWSERIGRVEVRRLRRTLAAAVFSIGCFPVVSGNVAGAEVLYSDKHGVKMEYRMTDTGHYVRCDDKNDPNYDKKIKIWKVTVTVTNGSGKRIKPRDRTVATITPKVDRGSSLDYCFYFSKFALRSIGYPDRGGLPFGIILGVRSPINAGQSLSESKYLYLYEDRKPIMTMWSFNGYDFVKDKPKGRQRAAGPSPPGVPAPSEKHPAPPNVGPPSGLGSIEVRVGSEKQPTRSHADPPSSRVPSGSLILLIDISGSMQGTKLSSAKQAAIETIRKAVKNKTEVAVLAFEGDCTDPFTKSIGFTRDESQLMAFVNGLAAQGGTPLATALDATNRFMNQHKSPASKTQMILLLADGDDDCGGLDAILRELKQKNLLYRHETVGLEVSDEARQQLQNIARQSGGTYHGATSQNLSKVFSDAVELMNMLDMLGKFR